MSNQKIYLIGMPNAGKSTIAKSLAKELNYDLYCLDDIITDRTKMSISEIFKHYGQSYFRQLETQILKEIDALSVNLVVDCGGGIVEKLENKQYMKGLVIGLDRNLEDLKKDINVTNRPLLQEKTIEQIKEERKEKYLMFADVLIENKTINQTLQQILTIIKNENN